MSLGTATGSDGNDALSLAVDNAVLNHGIVSVIAAGNSGDGSTRSGHPAPPAAPSPWERPPRSPTAFGWPDSPVGGRPSMGGVKPDVVVAGRGDHLGQCQHRLELCRCQRHLDGDAVHRRSGGVDARLQRRA